MSAGAAPMAFSVLLTIEISPPAVSEMSHGWVVRSLNGSSNHNMSTSGGGGGGEGGKGPLGPGATITLGFAPPATIAIGGKGALFVQAGGSLFGSQPAGKSHPGTTQVPGGNFASKGTFTPGAISGSDSCFGSNLAISGGISKCSKRYAIARFANSGKASKQAFPIAFSHGRSVISPQFLQRLYAVPQMRVAV